MWPAQSSSMRPMSGRWRLRGWTCAGSRRSDDFPDGVFVEDTALLLGDHAVILRPGAASRAGETESTAQGLAGAFTIHRLDAGHVDGGDVLRIGRTLYVGLSSRTDRAGLRALAESRRASWATMSSRCRSPAASI